MNRLFRILPFLIFCFALVFPTLIRAQGSSDDNQKRRSEFGGWLGATNPMPGTPTVSVLDTSLGGGFYGRLPIPYNLFAEFGGSYSVYLSQSERGLETLPLYGAVAYRIPVELPIQFFLKGGGGYAYTVARPADTARWNPLLFTGFEASFIAGRRIRIGVRFDYNKIMETNLDVPGEYRIPLASPFDDPRLQNPANYRLQNGDFFYFGLAVGVLF